MYFYNLLQKQSNLQNKYTLNETFDYFYTIFCVYNDYFCVKTHHMIQKM